MILKIRDYGERYAYSEGPRPSECGTYEGSTVGVITDGHSFFLTEVTHDGIGHREEYLCQVEGIVRFL